jgi:hypothetical protein
MPDHQLLTCPDCEEGISWEGFNKAGGWKAVTSRNVSSGAFCRCERLQFWASARGTGWTFLASRWPYVLGKPARMFVRGNEVLIIDEAARTLFSSGDPGMDEAVEETLAAARLRRVLES